MSYFSLPCSKLLRYITCFSLFYLYFIVDVLLFPYFNFNNWTLLSFLIHSGFIHIIPTCRYFPILFIINNNSEFKQTLISLRLYLLINCFHESSVLPPPIVPCSCALPRALMLRLKSTGMCLVFSQETQKPSLNSPWSRRIGLRVNQPGNPLSD